MINIITISDPAFNRGPDLICKYCSPGMHPAPDAGSALVWDHHSDEHGGAMRYSVSRHVWIRRGEELVAGPTLGRRYFAAALAADLFAQRWIVRRFGERVPIFGRLQWLCDYYRQVFFAPDTLLA